MVFCAISENEIVGSYFFEDGTAIRERYKRILRYFQFVVLAKYPSDMILQQYGAPTHYANIVRQYLDQKYPNRLMGREGPFQWPRQSLYLTNASYFLWVYIKDQIYRNVSDNLLNSRQRFVMLFKNYRKNTSKSVSFVTFAKLENIENRLSI